MDGQKMQNSEKLGMYQKRGAEKMENVNITLPPNDIKYIKQWAKMHNVTVSRAIHDHIWFGYHAQQGDYKPPT
jgi:hypothetical protein